MRKYKALEVAVHAAPDKQISLTNPDARSMATSGKDTGLVGYNVQAVVDAKHHLIVAHEVTNIGNDRSQLATMAKEAREATGVRERTAIADRGYFKGEEILACEVAGVTPIVPKPLTSGAKADGRDQGSVKPIASRRKQRANPSLLRRPPRSLCNRVFARPRRIADLQRLRENGRCPLKAAACCSRLGLDL
jgi:hypothetical protein